MYRRWAYMAIAIIASYLIAVKPVFSFTSDKGMTYERSFTMDMKQFQVTQTVLGTLDEEQKQVTPEREVKGTMSVMGLYVTQKILFWSSILCLFLFYPTRVRWYMSWFIFAMAILFYVFLLIYALHITNLYFATIAPSWTAIMPFIVLIMMVLLNRNVTVYGNYFDDIKVD